MVLFIYRQEKNIKVMKLSYIKRIYMYYEVYRLWTRLEYQGFIILYLQTKNILYWFNEATYKYKRITIMGFIDYKQGFTNYKHE